MQKLALHSLLLALLAAPAAAQAEASGDSEARVLVLRFSGSEGNNARGSVVTGLEDRVALEPYRNATTRAREDGLRLSDPASRARVARELNVDFLVRGEVSGRGGNKRTTIIIEDLEGNELARRQAPAPSSASRRRAIAAAAAEAMDEALASAGGGAGAGATAAAAGGVASGAQAEPEPEPAPDTEADDGGDALLTRTPRFVGYFGLGFRQRDAEIELESGMVTGHQVPFFATLSLRVESFPFGDHIEEEVAVRGLYARAEFHSGLGMVTENGAGQEIDTSYYDVMLHMGWFYPFARGKVGVLAGWGMQSFSFDDGIEFPDTHYSELRFAVGGGYDIIRDYLSATAEYGIQVPLSNDDLTLYGSKTLALGIDLILGLEGRLDFGLAYALRFGWERYNYSFYGDPDPSVEAGVSGGESGVWLDLQAGWVWD